jgi:demethoxyubiquinone hydroxylase (CLK1/Coq7/Cat5 family)
LAKIEGSEKLAEILSEFRDDELQHKETAIEHESKLVCVINKTIGHSVLLFAIKSACKGAIQVAKVL